MPTEAHDNSWMSKTVVKKVFFLDMFLTPALKLNENNKSRLPIYLGGKYFDMPNNMLHTNIAHL
jgi:hypothetical protein